MNRRRAAVGAIGATLLLFTTTGCGSDSDAEPAPDTATDVTVGATGAPGTDAAGETTTSAEDTTDAGTTTDDPAAGAVPEALQFTAPLVGGGTFDGAAAAGKPTVFWFWAPT